ncbi:class I SAM-dependent methyltransferase [Actinomadura barringtoniae]|uniref:Class I SAM-dependent methyltransferase n=1 Tax=Actinomadura barringtoniae TaxID=1427535 RepID=A0A939PMX2_9ACTN|nr:class I SAM-dependent methyltransferase [Actinomadura barringtoniae]MBO2455210.1 class I SAM-dependent methyltransferase [Actinomadura barringtoniae]
MRSTARDGWRQDHPWAPVYAFTANRPWLIRPVARLAFHTDFGLLHERIEAIGTWQEGTAVLDVPCGGGVALRGVRPGQGLRYVAADIAPTMLSRARHAAGDAGVSDQVETCEADVSELPFVDGEFDVCLSFTGLHCFPGPRAAVEEIARVLRPGGTLLLSWLCADGQLVQRAALALGRRMGTAGQSASTAQVCGWLDDVGFTDVRLTPSGAFAYVTATRS